MKQLIIHIIDLDTQKTWEVYSDVTAYLVLLQNSIINAKVLSNDSNFNLNLNGVYYV